MKRNKFAAALAVLTLLTTLTGCGQAKETGGALEPVTLNEVAHSIFYAPQYAAIELGYFKDEGYPSKALNDSLRATAKRLGINMIEGAIHSSDVFYRQPSDEKPTYWEKLRDERGCLAVEMESFALFANASVLGKEAACLLTISDSFISPEITTAEERQTCFTNMMKIALENL